MKYNICDWKKHEDLFLSFWYIIHILDNIGDHFFRVDINKLFYIQIEEHVIIYKRNNCYLCLIM